MEYKLFTVNPEANHIIEFKDVSLAFGSKVILNKINFTVDKQEIIAVIGPSGVGKSTILRLICNLLDPDSGEVCVSSTRKGMAFQFAALLNFLTVKENVALPLRKKTKMKEKEIDEAVAAALSSVGLKDAEPLYPRELSGGMQKRVSFARAVVTKPDIILYDEPTSGLDPMTSTMIISDICHLKQKVPAAGIIVTHDMDTIQKAADKVMLLFNGDIVFAGTPKELIETKNPYGIQFSSGSCEGPMNMCSRD